MNKLAKFILSLNLFNNKEKTKSDDWRKTTIIESIIICVAAFLAVTLYDGPHDCYIPYAILVGGLYYVVDSATMKIMRKRFKSSE